MKPGDRVTIQRANMPSCWAQATVGGVADDGGLLSLRIASPPLWFKRTMQARGIFLGPKAQWNLTLFRDHKNEWTDTQTLNQYTVTLTP